MARLRFRYMLKTLTRSPAGPKDLHPEVGGVRVLAMLMSTALAATFQNPVPLNPLPAMKSGIRIAGGLGHVTRTLRRMWEVFSPRSPATCSKHTDVPV